MHPVRRNNKIYASDSENSGKINNTSSLLHPTVDNQRLLKAILKSPETKEEETIISQLSQVRNSNNMGSLFSATGSDSVSSPQTNSHHTANYSSIQLYQSDEIHIRKMFESGQEVATRVGLQLSENQRKRILKQQPFHLGESSSPPKQVTMSRIEPRQQFFPVEQNLPPQYHRQVETLEDGGACAELDSGEEEKVLHPSIPSISDIECGSSFTLFKTPVGQVAYQRRLSHNNSTARSNSEDDDLTLMDIESSNNESISDETSCLVRKKKYN